MQPLTYVEPSTLIRAENNHNFAKDSFFLVGCRGCSGGSRRRTCCHAAIGHGFNPKRKIGNARQWFTMPHPLVQKTCTAKAVAVPTALYCEGIFEHQS